MSTIAKQDAAGQSGFWASLFQAGFYKPSQGRMVRQVTFGVVALLSVLLVYEISFFAFFQRVLGLGGSWVMFGVLALVALWVSLRMVNYSRFADFLISVEAELNKVSWPSSHSLWRATGVVIFVILALSAILYLFDLIWTIVFQFLRIRD
jgi:preprotein translocase subunit SecE